MFDDHVQRVFRADAPNRVRLTGITEHWTSEGKRYCCAIKDVFSNRIVGYSISDRMTAKQRRPASCAVTTWSDRWVASAQLGTTPPWRCSYRCQVGVGVLSRSRKM